MKQAFLCLFSYWHRHRLQCAIAVFGVALGVAVVTAMDLANGSALASFRESVRAVTGRATHAMLPAEPTYTEGVPEDLFPKIATVPGVIAAAPEIENSGVLIVPADAALPNDPDEARNSSSKSAIVRILGVNPFSENAFRPIDKTQVQTTVRGLGDRSMDDWLLTSDGCVLPQTLAERLKLGLGDTVGIVHSGKRQRLRLIGTYTSKDPLARGNDDVVLMDIAAVQERFGRPGRIGSIDLILPGGAAGEKVASEIRSLLPPGTVLQTPAERTGRTIAMLSAFQLNLTALSLLALVVGVFLVYNTLTVAVLQRLPIIGTLRCLGCSGRDVRQAILLEALLLGTVGSLLGLPAGTAMAGIFLVRVGGIVSDLYAHIGAFSIFLDPLALAKGFALGVVAALFGAFVPAREAGSISPVQVLRRSRSEICAQRGWRILGMAGLASFAIAVLLAVLPGASAVPGLAAAFALSLGGVLCAPALVRWFSIAGAWPLRKSFGTLGLLAARGLGAQLSRTGLAVGALGMALSMTLGVALMVSSFRATLDRWMDQALHADLYIRPAGPALLRYQSFVPGEMLEKLCARPEVEAVETHRSRDINLSNGVPVLVVGSNMPVSFLRGSANFPFMHGDGKSALDGVMNGGAMISESLSRKQHLGIGDSIVFPGAGGEVKLPIVAVYYEYATDRGVISMDISTYERVFHDARANSFAVYLRPGVDLEAFRDLLRREIGVPAGLYIFSNRTLREEASRVFDRTFAITGQLESLSLAVGLGGILSALLALLRERSADFALLRALGLPARGLFRLIVLEGVLLGGLAFLISCVLGPLLALLLIQVINVRAFGWTIFFSVHAAVFVRVCILALLMSAVAAIYPSWRARKLSIAGALREE